MKRKRLLTLIMAVCMVISVFPAMMASAEELATDNFEDYTKDVGTRIPLGTEHIWSSYGNRVFSETTWQPILGTDPEDPTNKVLRLDKPLTTTDGQTLSIITNNADAKGRISITFDLYVPTGETYGDGTLYNDTSLNVRDENKTIQFQAISTKDATSDFFNGVLLHLNRGGDGGTPKFGMGGKWYNISYNKWCPIKFVVDTTTKTVEYYLTGKSTPDTTTTFGTTYDFDYFKICMKPQIQSSLAYIDNVNVVVVDDAYAAEADADAIEIASVIGGEVTLPTTGANGSAITWESDVDGLIVNNTIVPGASAVTATLTATVTCGTATETRTFNVKVLKAGTIFADDFERELGSTVDVNGWTKHTPDNNNTLFTVAEDVNDPYNPTNRVLKVNKLASETANSNVIQRYIDRNATMNDFSVSFRMKSETESQYHMQIIDDNGGRKVAFDLGFNYAGSNISVAGYDTVNGRSGQTLFIDAGCLKINEWQDFKIGFDMSAKKFWLYVDGVNLTSTAIPFENEVPAIAAIRFRGMSDASVAGKGESILLVDDIEIASETAEEAGDVQVMYKNFSGFANRDTFSPVREGYIWKVSVAEDYVGKTAIFAVYGTELEIETDHLRMLSAEVVTLEAETEINHKISPYGKQMKMFILDEMGTLTPVLETPLEDSIGYLGHEAAEE